MVGSLGASSSMSSAAPAMATYTRVARPSEACAVGAHAGVDQGELGVEAALRVGQLVAAANSALKAATSPAPRAVRAWNGKAFAR